jgi:hypothetical protein
MSNASLFRKLTRKVITLPAATRAAREAGDIPEDQEVTVIIRKVTVGEVTARAGSPASIRERLRKLDPDESEEDRKARIVAETLGDQESWDELIAYNRRLETAIVCLGVASETVVDKPEAQLEGDEITPDFFGPDLSTVYNAILAFSDLPFTPAEVRDATTFRPEPLAAPVLADGEGAGHGPVDDLPDVEPGPV